LGIQIWNEIFGKKFEYKLYQSCSWRKDYGKTGHIYSDKSSQILPNWKARAAQELTSSEQAYIMEYLHILTDICENCVERHLKVPYDKNRINPTYLYMYRYICENCVGQHNLSDCVKRPLRPIYTDSDFDSVGCDSRIRHRTKIGFFPIFWQCQMQQPHPTLSKSPFV
jgi:hypothetical protein